MSDEISPKLTKLFADLIHKEQVFRRLQTEFDVVCVEYELDARDKDLLRKALQQPPSGFDVDLPKFLEALHKEGFARLSWVGILRMH